MKKGEELSVAKIVGSSDEKRWVQVHTFFPDDKEKKKKRGILLAVLTLKDLEEEEVEVVEVGREVIARLHEEYYGNLEGNAFFGLKRAVGKLREEVKIEILAGAVILGEEERVLYLVTEGEGRVMIQRGEALGEVLRGKKGEVKTASGYLEEGDLIVLGNGGFFKIVGGGVLKGFLGGGSVEEIVDELAPVIHGRREGVGAAALICQVTDGRREKKTEGVGEARTEKRMDEEREGGKKSRFLDGVLFLTQKIEGGLETLLSFFSKKRGVYIRGERGRKAKRTVMTVAVLMMGLLLMSVFFGLKRKGVQEGRGSWEEFRVQIEEQIGQAESLVELNPTRSKELAEEVWEELKVWDSKAGESQEAQEIKLLMERVGELLKRASKKYEIESADVFLDLNLIRKDTQGARIGLYKSQAVILDKNSEVILGVNIDKKQGKILGGRLGEVNFASVFLGKAFYPKESQIFWIDLSSGVASKAGEISEGVGRIDDFVAYAGNVYVLDGEEGQIWKLPGIEGGIGAARGYLAKSFDELSSGISMAIDGSIWVLTREGLVYKFIQNRRERFVIVDLDEDFGDPVALYTDDDCEKLYVLDKEKTRVVIIGKDGRFEGQYVWSGIAGVDDMVASEKEGKILLLSGSKLFEIELKQQE